MTLTAAPKRPTVATRRFGYVVSVLINAAMLYAVNGWPGWEAVPFLTDDMRLVVGAVNASIAVGLAANVMYLVRDPARLKALGDMLTNAVGIVALSRMWQVFPFDFGSSSVDWALVARIMLGLAIVGSAIAMVVAFASLVKSVVIRAS